jgi:hypothetical protein
MSGCRERLPRVSRSPRRLCKELLDPQRYTIAWLDAQVWAGFIQCWSNDRACILAKINHYPTGAFDIHGMAATGELDGIKELIGKAEEWARGARRAGR